MLERFEFLALQPLLSALRPLPAASLSCLHLFSVHCLGLLERHTIPRRATRGFRA